MQVEADRVHDDEHDSKDKRHRQRDDKAGAPAERKEADEENDRQRFDERTNEFPDRVVHHCGLIGDLLEIEPLGDRAREVCSRGGNGRTEFQDVGALCHHDADADGRLASLPDHKVGRIDEAVRHGCDVAHAEHAAIGFHGCLGNRLGAVERAGHAQRYTLRGGLQDTGRHHRVLTGEGLEQLVGGDTQRCELGVREFDEEFVRPACHTG